MRLVWSEQTISAFKVLVCSLISALVLALPDTRIGAMFTIATDASNVGIAGVCSKIKGLV